MPLDKSFKLSSNPAHSIPFSPKIEVIKAYKKNIHEKIRSLQLQPTAASEKPRENEIYNKQNLNNMRACTAHIKNTKKYGKKLEQSKRIL